MTLSGYDAAYPPSNPPATDVVLIYSGGDTPHVWTDAEIAEQKARYRLPIWVRSNAGVDPKADATAFRAWLEAKGCPKGVATVLDLETLVDRVYVLNFGAYMHSFGWLVLPYGSRSTLYQNPSLDGYFDAHPDDPAGTVDSGNVASQDVYTNAYDLDYILNTVPLWDTRPDSPSTPAAAPVASTPSEQEIIMGLPSNCSDIEAVKAQVKEWWISFRTDALTTDILNLIISNWTRPAGEAGPFGSTGFGGDPFLLLSNIVDSAGEHARFPGAV